MASALTTIIIGSTSDQRCGRFGARPFGRCHARARQGRGATAWREDTVKETGGNISTVGPAIFSGEKLPGLKAASGPPWAPDGISRSVGSKLQQTNRQL
jgi:hypothetical protein